MVLLHNVFKIPQTVQRIILTMDQTVNVLILFTNATQITLMMVQAKNALTLQHNAQMVTLMMDLIPNVFSIQLIVLPHILMMVQEVLV